MTSTLTRIVRDLRHHQYPWSNLNQRRIIVTIAKNGPIVAALIVDKAGSAVKVARIA